MRRVNIERSTADKERSDDGLTVAGAYHPPSPEQLLSKVVDGLPNKLNQHL